MSNTLKNILIFLGGAGTGAVSMYFVSKRIFLKKYYEAIDKYEEMLANFVEYQNDVDEYIVEELDTEHAKAVANREELNKPDVSTYVKALKGEGYATDKQDQKPNVDYTSFSKKHEPEPTPVVEEKKGNDDEVEEVPPIRMVTEEYFDELSDEDYQFVSYTYFADHILGDENEEKLDEEEIENSISSETIKYLDTHDEDTVYVVNDTLQIAFEVVKDLRLYKDVVEARGGW